MVRCGTPRIVFNDLPLGNPLGVPGDRAMQQSSVTRALELARDAVTPGTVLKTEFKWASDDSWKANFFRVGETNLAELWQRGEKTRQERQQNRANGLTRER